ncbi:MAG TPA: LysM peptidoglycan-binding domain-containing protein [Haliscomenobacter sp.]|nr:LysM peptidoglycan-binding domain-containing protein [Haliscomenobacter sp.]
MTIQLHQVAPNETLHGIARQYDVKVRHLKALNGLHSAKLTMGQTLLIQILADEEPEESPALKTRGLLDDSSSVRIHTVKAGDSLYRIAKLYNLSVEQLKKDNNLSSDQIGIGKQLIVGRKAGPAIISKPESVQYHQVKAGDTLYKIAKLYNTSVTNLKLLNKLSTDSLSIGTKLQVGSKVAINVDTGGTTYPPPAPVKPTPPVVNPPSPPVNPPTDTPPNAALLSYREDASYLYLDIQLLSGKREAAKLQKYEGGYRYAGKSSAVPTAEAVQSIGMSAQVFNALQFCKKVEGYYDAINTYDSGVFSYGFIQFTSKFKSLDQLLQSMKTNAPLQYQQTFERAGIFVQNNVIRVVVTPQNQFTGDAAWQYIKGHPTLLVPFIQAGFVPQLVLEQYRVANALYAQTSLNATLSITGSNGLLLRSPLASILPDLETQALAISMGVNLGPNTMAMVMSEALSDLVQKRNYPDVQALARTPWREVCQQLIQFEGSPIPRPNQNTRKSKFTIERARLVLERGITVVI